MALSETLTAIGKGVGFGREGSPTFGAKPVEIKIENKNEDANQNRSSFIERNKFILVTSIILVIGIGSYFVFKGKNKRNG